MKIDKLDIKGFGRLNNLTLLLDKGFNVIYGSNEAGKSTIQWFIRAMFFGVKGGKASKDGTPPPLKRFKPWTGSEYSGFMEYTLDNGEVYRVGRNFSTNTLRIFDPLFNDITNTFETTREKGANFAEKHLGLNDVCFEKTAFIKQLDVRIGDDASKELHNRIINVSQTGFEDISFRRAEEALKNALKAHVGTDKTSTRPLDKVLNRLSELKGRREEYIERKNKQFSIENDLNIAITVKNNVESKKNFLEKLMEVIERKGSIEKRRKIVSELEEILKAVTSDEEELKKILEREEEFSHIKEEFKRFSCYDNEDIDRLDAQYNRLNVLMEDHGRLEAEIHRRKKEAEDNRKWLDDLKAFGEMGEGIENKVISLSRSLEELKSGYKNNSIEILDEKIRSGQKKLRIYRRRSLLYGILSAVIAVLGFSSFQPALWAALPVFALAVVYILLGNKESKGLTAMQNERKNSFINVSKLMEEIKETGNALSEILERVGTGCIEDFLKLKVKYDSVLERQMTVNADICKLESQSEAISREINLLKSQICLSLIEAGVLPENTCEFEEEHIKSFKYGVRRYKGIEPSMLFAAQRIEDVSKNIERHYKNALSLCGDGQFRPDKEYLSKYTAELDNELKYTEKNLEADIKEVSSTFYAGGFYTSSDDLGQMHEFAADEYARTCEEHKNVLLNIREYETILKSFADDEEEMQKIDEEICELEARKSQLEDINISLKTALDVLTEASSEIQKDFVPALNYRMTDIINKITAGRYCDLRADSTLALKAIAPETGDVVPAAVLSGGTADQMYLALRLSMADMVAQTGEKLPFILDEAFAQYDDMRTRMTLEFFKSFEGQRQMILFTCKDREVEMARQVFRDMVNVIEL